MAWWEGGRSKGQGARPPESSPEHPSVSAASLQDLENVSVCLAVQSRKPHAAQHADADPC